MKNITIQYGQLAKSKAFHAIAASLVAVSLVGCGGDSGVDSGEVVNYVELPTDAFTSLYCPEIGVGEETCVLYDPVNPYVRASVTDVTKWDLADDAPSFKSKFYLWATALVRNPQGENQFYTADSLHNIYKEEGSTLAQEQAKKGYRAVLDNFYGSVTFTGPVNAQTENLLRDWVSDRLVNPVGLPQLYDDQSLAIQALEDWGYSYDEATRMISKASE